MMLKISLVRTLLRAGLSESLGFRLNTIVGVLEKATRLFILYWFFRAVLPAADDVTAVIRYLFVAMLVEAIVRMELIEQMALKIVTGEATYWLTRPGSPLHPLFWYTLGKNLPAISICGMLLLVGLTGSGGAGGAGIWSGALGLVAFPCSLVLAYLLSFYLQYLFGIGVFFTLNSWGTKLLFSALMYLLSGVMFPVEFLPGALARLITLLPFHHAVGTPTRVYLGTATLADGFLQLVWVGILAATTRFIVRRCGHHFVTVGG